MWIIAILLVIFVVTLVWTAIASPDYNRNSNIGGAIIGNVLLAFLVLTFVGGGLTEVEAVYTQTIIESELLPAGDGNYVLVANGRATWRTADGPESASLENVKIIPSDDRKVVETDFDTTRWAVWPRDREYELFAPSDSVEGLTDSE